MKTFSRLLYESFLRVHGWSLALAGIALNALLFFVGPETQVQVGWLALTASLSGFLFVVAFDAAWNSWKESQRGLPEVKRTLEPPSLYSGVERLLLVTPSELYGVDTLVSIYVKEGEYERLIAVGKVLSVQENGYLQIGIRELDHQDTAISDNLNGNDASFLRKLLVKPSVPAYLAQEV